LDFHGCTEAMIIAMQTWDHQGMTFVPNLQFLEFIPEEDALRSRADKSYRPRTLLLDELTPGNYELVITSFHGGPFLRYRLGHLVKIQSMRNEACDIDIPQMSFLARIDDQIDIAGFTRLGEKVIWQAVENTGLEYEDWVACKEVEGRPILHLFVELKGASRSVSAEQVAAQVHAELKRLDQPYAELESFAGIHPLRITILPEGAFQTYKLRQKAAGADLASTRPPHINPAQRTLDFLVATAAQVHARTADAVVA
ncbi:MAG TPA: GH3 auxin-responsive promoter family protein, partial [bacterium]|nr:GH3 auxin-responsive promoter family protein [bacterium]